MQTPVLAGRVQVPCSKSIAHRALIGNYLAGRGNIRNLIWNEDLRATRAALAALSVPGQDVWCGASASTLRFLLPLALAKGGRFVFTGSNELARRPLTPYLEIMERQHIRYRFGELGGLSLTVEGKLKADTFVIPGNISSQFVSGLLMALPLLEEDSEILVEGALESQPYVDMTGAVLHQYGVQFVNEDYRRFFVPGQQNYLSCDFTVEGDYSLGAVWLAAGLLGQQPLEVTGLMPNSIQGDGVCLELFRRMGGQIAVKEKSLVAYPSELQGLEMDARDCPDLVPVFAVLGCLAKGRTKICHAGRLRIKESDRLAALAEELGKLGAKIEETRDGLLIEGVGRLHGGEVQGHFDHRIIMALALASLRSEGKVLIEGAEQVRKSYENFWQDFVRLGGNYA